MQNLVSNAISYIGSLFQGLQVKRFLAVALVGFLLLTTNVDAGRNNKSVTGRIDNIIHQDGSDRPKTTGEWKQEAREVDSVGERLQNIGQESADAFEDFGELYPDTAERSARSLPSDNLNRGQR